LVCHLYLLLALASAFILESEYCGTHDHILLSQIRGRLLWLAGIRWRYWTRPPHGCTTAPGKIRVKVKVTLRLAVYRQSVCLGVKPLETHNQFFF
jgi:hypothetical protein